MKLLNKAILPKGFLAAGVSCGIKRSGKPDLALFYSRNPAVAAAVFTTNTVKAAPVELDMELLKHSRKFQAIIVNSGNANCFTGARGSRDARTMSEAARKKLGLVSGRALVASTGIIGKPLPVQRITSACSGLIGALSRQGIGRAAQAILTTDTCTKEATVNFSLGNKTITVCAVAKGAGMIAPQMATMLCFIFTDAALAPQILKKTLRGAVEASFNCITVDGCMSTNDSVIALANGVAGNTPSQISRFLPLFSRALNSVCGSLARKVVCDAEGATKLITIELCGARTDAQAKTAALSIANSNLFKTAVYGENQNYGRIIAAVGASGVYCRQDRFKLDIGNLKASEILVRVDLGVGRGRAQVLTSDLTPEYVKINAEYS